VVTTVNGDATLFRAAATQPVSLHMRDEIFMRDRIHTQPRSLVRVLLAARPSSRYESCRSSRSPRRPAA
jgi:hypothetical protein